MNEREEFIKQFVQAGKAKGASKDEVARKLQSALAEYDARVAAPTNQQSDDRNLLEKITSVVLPVGSQVAQTAGTALGLRSGAQSQADDATMAALHSSQQLIRQAQQSTNPEERERLLALSRQIDRGVSQTAEQFNQTNIEKMPTAEVNPVRQGMGVGLEAGAWLVPGGKGLKANVGSGALAGSLVGASQQEGNIILNTLTGGLTGAAASGALTLGGKALDAGVRKAGQIAEKQGKELVLRGLKPSKTQLSKFKERTGKDLAAWLNEQQITGNFADEATARIDDLQTQFDDLAVRSGAKVNKGKLQQAFIKRMAELSDSIVPSVKGKSHDLKEVMDNIVAKHGDEIDVGALTQERRAIDRFLKDNQFGIPADQANYLRSARDALQETIQEATKGRGAKDLKTIGLELRDLYEFQKIANAQQNLGRGTNLFGLLNLLGAGSGGIVGGIPGAVVGIAAPTIMRNPKVVSGASKGLQVTGKGVQRLPKIDGRFDPLLRAMRNTAAYKASEPKRLPDNSQF